MIKIVFKNLDKSELAKQVTLERLQESIDRFPGLNEGKVTVTLSMENSPIDAGPDFFTVKFRCHGGKYKGVILKKSATSLYIALADLGENLLERLNRFGDKQRIKRIKHARKTQEEALLLEATA